MSLIMFEMLIHYSRRELLGMQMTSPQYFESACN